MIRKEVSKKSEKVKYVQEIFMILSVSLCAYLTLKLITYIYKIMRYQGNIIYLTENRRLWKTEIPLQESHHDSQLPHNTFCYVPL